jgi:ribosomal protein S27E
VLSSMESMSHFQTGACNNGNDDQVTYSTPVTVGRTSTCSGVLIPLCFIRAR